MSRSFKKTPIYGIAVCDSEKYDKRRWHKKFRKACSLSIQNDKELPDRKEVSDPWEMGKDGKLYWFPNEGFYPKHKYMKK